MDKDVVILTDVEGQPLYPMTKMGAVTDETGRGLPTVLGGYLTDATVVERLAALIAGGNGRELAAALLGSSELSEALAAKAGTEEVEGVRQALNTLMEGNVSDAIESFREVLEFLDGVTDEERLSGLLNELRVKIDKVAADGAADVKALERQVTEVKAVADKVSAMTRTFTRVGYVDAHGSVVLTSGEMAAAEVTDWTSVSLHTEPVPVNRRYDIVVSSRPTPIQSQIAWYDAGGGFIGNIVPSETPPRFHEWTVSRADIPENAAYFRLSSYVGQPDTMPWYRHAPTDEARGAALVDAVQAAKRLLFIDEWCQYGEYDPANAPDAEHQFYANKVWMTYNEAIATHEKFVWRDGSIPAVDGDFSIRTNILAMGTLDVYDRAIKLNGAKGYSLANLLRSTNVETLRVSPSDTYGMRVSDISSMLYSYNLNFREVLGTIDMINAPHDQKLNSHPTGSPNLTTIKFKNLLANLNMQYAPKLDLESLQFLVANAANSKQITVTVHPDVMAKLGRNLLTGTQDFSGNWISKVHWTKQDERFNGCDVYKFTYTERWFGLSRLFTCELGKIYTFSAWVKIMTGAPNIYLNVGFSNQGNMTPSAVVLPADLADGEWHRVSITFTADNADNLVCQCRVERGDTFGDLYVAGYKLEEGAVASEWSPAPEDSGMAADEAAAWAQVRAEAAARKITFATVEAAALSDGDIMDVDYE